MSRHAIRQHKKQLHAGLRSPADPEHRGLAQESALALLSRSIDFGHPRLALVRLAIAVAAGARVPEDHWAYCATVAERSADPVLRAMWARSRQQQAGR